MKRRLHILALLLCSCYLTITANTTPPQANFGSDLRSGCGPITIKFFDSSSGDIEDWHWEFPRADTTIYTTQNPIVTYSTPGTYDVTLRISGPGGTDEVTESAYIEITNQTTIPSFSTAYQGYEVSFSNQSQHANSYLWDFGDGTFSVEENPTHIYRKDGVYIVKLKTINDCGDRSRSEVIIFEPQPQPINYTANDRVTVYDESFRPGVNLGYFPPWSDMQLADIAAGNPEHGVPGAGCKSVRPALHESFLEEWGYDIRLETFEHYGKIGLKDNTAIVGFPSEEHRDPNFYCPDYQSTLFANLYTDIWDNGENGTPVNDENYFALYLYKMIHLYGEHIQYYEIWNEPGFDYTFVTGWLPRGTDGNWWENDPDPCDYKLRAPIYHYVRTLRVAYEVIKTLDPESNVTIASVGYTSFLDAVLRNTDNPAGGEVSSEYPLGGGAYFDAIAVHSYPHFDGTLRYWDQNTQSFVHSRHSDKAASGIKLTKDTFQTVLAGYGYDGMQYPEKEYIITEINIPRKQFADYIGGEEQQINYIIKAYIESVRSNIRQMHVYDMSESFNYNDAVNEFQLMGLYKRLFGIWPYNQEINNIGIAYKTASDLLYQSTYDVTRTAELNLPPEIDGAAFLDDEGYYTYVLWAKTTIDQSEDANASYSFPAGIASGYLLKREWDDSYNPIVDSISTSNISLTATPVFLTNRNDIVLVPPTAKFDVDHIQGCAPFIVQFTDQSTQNVSNWQWSFPGGTPGSSNERNPLVSYNNPGVYSASLTVSNAAGSSTYQLDNIVRVDQGLPSADFEVEIFDKIATYTNRSTNASHYRWDLGDFNITDEINPTHNYPIPAIYYTELIAMNGCGADTTTGITIINPNQTIPEASFSASIQAGCAPLTVEFNDQSTANTTEWWWWFQGGTPAHSTDPNPVITYNEPGVYFVQMIATNAAGSDIEYRDSFIIVDLFSSPQVDFNYSVAQDNRVSFNNQSTNASSYLWDFGDGNTSNSLSPVHEYTADGSYTVTLWGYNACDTVKISLDITVVTPPLADFFADKQRDCSPLQVQFSDASSSNTMNVEWTFPGGIPSSSTERNPLITYTSPGTFEVQLKAINSLSEDVLIRSDYITVLDVPTADFHHTPNGLNVIFTNTTQNGTQFRWNFGDGGSSTESDPNYEYSSTGDYTVTLIAYNSCGNDTSQQIISVSTLNTSIYAPTALSQLILYPNPNNGQFFLSLKGRPQAKISLSIYNLLGQQQVDKQIDFRSGKTLQAFDFRLLAKGTYLLKINAEEEVHYRKFIVQ